MKNFNGSVIAWEIVWNTCMSVSHSVNQTVVNNIDQADRQKTGRMGDMKNIFSLKYSWVHLLTYTTNTAQPWNTTV